MARLRADDLFVSSAEKQVSVPSKRSSAMVDVKMVTQSASDYRGDDDILAYEFSDDALERVADVERLGAVTLAFCSGLDTCPS
jgi:hypothetical protein